MKIGRRDRRHCFMLNRLSQKNKKKFEKSAQPSTSAVELAVTMFAISKFLEEFISLLCYINFDS